MAKKIGAALEDDKPGAWIKDETVKSINDRLTAIEAAVKENTEWMKRMVRKSRQDFRPV